MFNLPDTITTIAVGRLNKDGLALDPIMWFDVGAQLTQACMRHGTLVAITKGNGVTTDQPSVGIEECQVFIVANANRHQLRDEVCEILRAWGLSSACFSHDGSHEPVRSGEL